MNALQRFLPIVVGLALGWLIFETPDWLRALGPASYLVTGGLAFVLLLAFVGVLISANLPADLTVAAKPGEPVPAELAALAARYRALGFVDVGPPLEVGVAPPALMVALLHERERTYGTVFRTGTVPAKVGFDLVSILEDGRGGLTTGADPAGATLPAAPGGFRQVIAGAEVEALFEHHRRALGWLRTRGLAPRPVSADRFAADLREAVAIQRRSFLANPVANAAIALWRSATRRTPHAGPLSGQRIAERQLREVSAGRRAAA